MTDILTLLSGPMDREQKLEQALKMARSWMHCVEPRLLDTPNFRRDMEALDAALSAPKAEALQVAAQGVIDRMFDTYRARNGRDVSIESYDGEKCWIVHSDDIEELRAALLYTSPVPALTDEAVERAQDSLLDALRENSWDLKCFSIPTGQGDADIGWHVVEHHMAKPHERVVAEVYVDDPAVAIRAALLAAFPSKGGTNG